MDAVFHDEALVTGNEDGAQQVGQHLVGALQEQGFSIPPNANPYWAGEAGPEPSYREVDGERHLFTNQNLRYAVHNCRHLGRVLQANPYPANRNQLGEEARAESDPE